MKYEAANLTLSFEDVPEDRLRELILYIADKCSEDPSFGATKLNKILYFADFHAYRQRGRSITGAEYVKLEKGPAPRRMLPISEAMKVAGDIAIEHKARYEGYPQNRTVALRDADLSKFTADELALVDAIIEKVRGVSAAVISQASHARPWRIAHEGEAIPYEAALLSDKALTDFEIARVRELNTIHGWE